MSVWLAGWRAGQDPSRLAVNALVASGDSYEDPAVLSKLRRPVSGCAWDSFATLSRVPACPGGRRQPRRQRQKAVVIMENHSPPVAFHDRDRLTVKDSGISVTIMKVPPAGSPPRQLLMLVLRAA
jgi:hypothetical protein